MCIFPKCSRKMFFLYFLSYRERWNLASKMVLFLRRITKDDISKKVHWNVAFSVRSEKIAFLKRFSFILWGIFILRYKISGTFVHNILTYSPKPTISRIIIRRKTNIKQILDGQIECSTYIDAFFLPLFRKTGKLDYTLPSWKHLISVLMEYKELTFCGSNETLGFSHVINLLKAHRQISEIPDNWRQIYKQTSSTFYTSNDVSLKHVEKKKLLMWTAIWKSRHRSLGTGISICIGIGIRI